MKFSSLILFFGIIVVAIGLALFISGGIFVPAAEPATPAPTPTVVVIVPETAATIPVTTSLPAIPADTVPATKATVRVQQLTADDIRSHFLDIAFNPTNRLERLNYSSDRPRVIVAALSADDGDLDALMQAATDFNEASRTVRISENIKETDNGDVTIKFLPENGLNSIDINGAPASGPFPEVLTRGEIYQGDVLAAKVMRGTIYINANLKGDARRHILVRSLMYEMGLTGETSTYDDSVFFSGENTNTVLSPADLKAIAMLYQPGFANGMSAEDMRKVIYTP